MKQYSDSKKKYLLPGKMVMVIICFIAVIVFMNFGFRTEPPVPAPDHGHGHEHGYKHGKVPADGLTENGHASLRDSIASVKAFAEVYKVLMSPRCMNCHPSGDIPLQGDDSHPHAMLPKRGKDGKGLYAMKCSNCHQPTNIAGLNKPPGNPNWHLPPADMKMVFEGKTAEQLARQLVNPKTNGNKNMQQLIEHADDGLVKAGWDPGEGRTLPPMSHAAFKKAWVDWISNGAYAPASK